MSRNQSNSALDCKVYVGGLTRNASREEIERAFGHYGKLTNVFVARNPPGFAFVEFEDSQDADDAVRALDGRVICGVRVRVELSHGKSRNKGPMKRYNDRHKTRRSRERSFDKRRGSYSRSRSRSKNARENGRDSRRRQNRSISRSRSRS